MYFWHFDSVADPSDLGTLKVVKVSASNALKVLSLYTSYNPDLAAGHTTYVLMIGDDNKLRLFDYKVDDKGVEKGMVEASP